MISDVHFGHLKGIMRNSSGWLKFLGIVNIVMGVLIALTIVGIIVAWLPIWMGLLLYRAGSHATQFTFSESGDDLVEALDKLRTYFVLQVILGILVLIQIVFSLLFFGAFSMMPFSPRMWYHMGF
jgi:hypothetical protein